MEYHKQLPTLTFDFNLRRYMKARPLFREKHTDDMSEADATELIHNCLRACVMRDKSMMNKFQIAKAGGLLMTSTRPTLNRRSSSFSSSSHPACLYERAP